MQTARERERARGLSLLGGSDKRSLLKVEGKFGSVLIKFK